MKTTELRAIIAEEVKSVLNELYAFNVTNDEDAIKAIDDVAANLRKWKSPESAHYSELLYKVIEYLQRK